MTPARIVTLILGILAVVLIIVFITGNNGNNDNDIPTPPENNNNGATEDIMAQLPHEITIGDRTVVFDTETVSQEDQNEFTPMAAPLTVESDEDPIEYMERYLQNTLTAQHIQDQPEFYEYSVSFYQQGENSLTVFVRVDNIPDDSIGAGEERFDFEYSNNNWAITWYGERHFCRRPDAEFWLPADQLCP